MAYNLIFVWPSSRTTRGNRKRPRDEEEFEAMAFAGFESIGDEEVIIPVVPLKIIEPTDDRQLVITPSAPRQPSPQVQSKRKKRKVDIPPRETRSKAVKPSSNTRSKTKMWNLNASCKLWTFRICNKVSVVICENFYFDVKFEIKFKLETKFEFEANIWIWGHIWTFTKPPLNSFALWCDVTMIHVRWSIRSFLCSHEKCASNEVRS